MRYHKPPLTFEQQADLLLQRGLVADRATLIARLRAVSYYRLSAYWHPFRGPNDTIHPGTSLDVVWGRYVFDRRLRLVVSDAIERIEVALRTRVACALSLQSGPFAYTTHVALPGLSRRDHAEFHARVRSECVRSREPFMEHFHTKYSSETDAPIWMAIEVMTFGGLLTLFRGAPRSVKQQLAAELGVADTVLESWLLALHQIRNICAHHARLWNRAFGVRPAIPRRRKHPQWHDPVPVGSDRLFGIATVLCYLMARIAPQSGWSSRFAGLLARSATIPLHDMGFAPNWRDCPIWAGALGSSTTRP